MEWNFIISLHSTRYKASCLCYLDTAYIVGKMRKQQSDRGCSSWMHWDITGYSTIFIILFEKVSLRSRVVQLKSEESIVMKANMVQH